MVETLTNGRRLGPFVLIRRVGYGGSAEVWQAEKVDGAGGNVALKFLTPHLDQYSSWTRFLDEIRVAKLLEHKHIVQVYGLHRLGGYFLQSMEFVDGTSLRTLLAALVKNRHRLPVEWSLIIMRDIARGLAYVHSRMSDSGSSLKIVHRDVSPDNVLVGQGGVVKLTDFGIAIFDDRLDSSQTGVFKGKFGYMAPEQLSGESKGPHVDIFCAGIVFWELLASQRLFPAQRGAVSPHFMAVLNHGTVPSVTLFNVETPDPVAEIVHRMLRVSTSDRPESMAEVLQAIEAGIKQKVPEPDVARRAIWDWIVSHVMKPHSHTKEIRCLAKTVSEPVQDSELPTLTAQQLIVEEQ